MCDCDVLTPDYDESGYLMCREIHLKAKRDVVCVECHTNVPAGTGNYFVKGNGMTIIKNILYAKIATQ